jgi:hypothetical protein
MKKQEHGLNREFSKEEVQMASQYMFNFPGYKRDANQNNT